MAKDNETFVGKADLDNRVDAYTEKVYGTFDYDRMVGRTPRFGKYYYPAMVVCCSDKSRKNYGESYSRTPYVKEYELTNMAGEMSRIYNMPRPFSFKDLKLHSLESRFRIGNCAEQHAANEMLFCIKQRHQDVYTQMKIKEDVYFSKAVRPSTGEVFPYCINCKALFDL